MVQVLRRILLTLVFAASSMAQVLTVPNGGTGNNTLTAHGPLVGNGTGTVTSLGPGTSGQCLISGGPTVDPVFAACPGTSPQVLVTTGNAPLTLVSPDGNTTLGIVMANGTNPTLTSSTNIVNVQTLAVNNLVGTGVSCLQATAAGAVQRTGSTCTTSTLISNLGPAGTGNVIGNASYQQNWNWSFTGTSAVTGLALAESPVSTSTATTNNLLSLQTAVGSTVRPFAAFVHGGGTGLLVNANGDITAGGTATFIGPHRASNITGSTQCVQADSSGNLTGTGAACGGGGAPAFSAITTGNNTTAAMTVGSGASLAPSATSPGTISANQVNGAAVPVSATTLATNASGQIVAGAGGATSWSALTAPTTNLSLSMVGNTTLFNVDASAVGGHDAFAISEVGASAPANSVLLGLFAKNTSMSPLQAQTTSGTGGFNVDPQLGNIVLIGSSKLVGGVQLPAAMASKASLATDSSGNIVAGGAVGFGSIASGTNTTASMTVGSGAFLGTTGSGSISANQINGSTIPVSTNWLSTNSSGALVGGTSPIVSINSDATPAQTITNGAGIHVSTASGTTTISATGAPRSCTDSGGAGAVTLTCTPASGPGAYVKGESFTFFPNTNSTGAATIVVDSRAAAVTMTSLPSPFASSNPSLNVNYPVTATYDGTRFSVGCPVLTNPTNAPAGVNQVFAGGSIIGASGNCPTFSQWAVTNFTLGAPNTFAVTIGSNGAVNASVSNVTFSPASVAGGPNAYTGGNVLLKAGDNNNTNVTETAGNLEIRPGTWGNYPTTTTAQGGELSLETSALATAGFTQGMAACISASASSAGAAGHYSPCSTANAPKWIGVFSQATSASATATFVQVKGDAPFYSAVAATWTAGDYICLDTGNASAFVNSTSTACPAGLQAGIASWTDASSSTTHYGVLARR